MTAQSLVRVLASLVTAAFFSLALLFNPRAHASLVSSVESVNIYNQNSFFSLATIFSSLIIHVLSCNMGTESFLLMSALFKLALRGRTAKGTGGWEARPGRGIQESEGTKNSVEHTGELQAGYKLEARP